MMTPNTVLPPLKAFEATFPNHIWLDVGEDSKMDIAPGATFHDLHEVTWSEDNASGYGVQYTRTALALRPGGEPSDAKSSGLVDAIVAAAEPFLLIGLDEHDTEKLCDAIYLALRPVGGADKPAEESDTPMRAVFEFDRDIAQWQMASAPYTAKVPSDDRARFETFANKEGYATIEKKPDGRYWSSHTDLMWRSWVEAIQGDAIAAQAQKEQS